MIYVIVVLTMFMTSHKAHGSQGLRQNVLNIPESAASQSSTPRPLAWTSDVISQPMSDVTVCVWAKSNNLRRTGTLFSYSATYRKLELSLVGLKSTRATDYDVYLAAKGRRSSKAIRLPMDDVIWHYVCVTWSMSGRWNVYMDGDVIENGTDLQSSEPITQHGNLHIGSTDAELLDRYSVFTGKVTGLTVWGRELPPNEVRLAGDCKTFARRQGSGISLRDPPSSGSDARLHADALHDWHPSSVTSQWPAKFYGHEDVCRTDVTVECTQNRMLISADATRPSSLKIGQEDLHLNDPDCKPTARGRNGGRFVFDVTSLESCGTKRTVTDREVVYSNRVSNSPTTVQVILFGYLYSAGVRCHYPIDLTVSALLIPPDDKHAVSRTVIRNPKTNEEDMEAVVLLFGDSAFSEALTQNPRLSPTDSLYVGVLLENMKRKDEEIIASNNDDDTNEDVNVVVDECFVRSVKQRRKIISDGGCWSAAPDISVLENGRRPQARYKLPSSTISFTNGPVYLQCKVYPCVGESCAPSCGASQSSGTPSRPSDRRGSRAKREVTDTDNPQPEYYDITIGPLYADGFWNDGVNKQQLTGVQQQEPVLKSPIFIATLGALCLVTAICFGLIIGILWHKYRALSNTYNVTAPVEIVRHKRRNSADPSVTSLSERSTSVTSEDSYTREARELYGSSLPSIFTVTRANSCASERSMTSLNSVTSLGSCASLGSQQSIDSMRFSASWH